MSATTAPGKPLILYRFYDNQDNLLYIGITNSPQARWNNHRNDKSWFKHVVRSTMEHFATRAELEAAEIQAIQTEKPRHNVTHSVISAPKQIKVADRVSYGTSSKDASTFPAPDGIASGAPTEAEREARLDALEQQVAHRAVLIYGMVCPSCRLKCVTREWDGLIKCLACLNMWTPEELDGPSDLEVLKKQMEESA